jgi:selenocysteine-specific elongation factor
VTTEDLARGMTLAPPDTFKATRRVDVSFGLLPSAKALKDRARVHLHAYTSETIAEVALYEDRTVKPGATAYAQLRMAEPALLLPGDRFILRQFSPVITIGGGTVLDAGPMVRAKKNAVVEFLHAVHGGQRDRVLSSRLVRREREGMTLAQLMAETGWTKRSLDQSLTQLIDAKQVMRLGERYADASAVEGLKAAIVQAIDDFHKKNPLVAGISKEELRERVNVAAEVFIPTLDLLMKEKKLEVAGELVRLPGRGVVLKDEEAESKKTIEQAFASAGLQVPALHEVMAGLKVDKLRAQKIVTLLLRDKVLLKISNELVFHHSAIEKLRRQIAGLKAKVTGGTAKIDVSTFKEMTGVSRKYAIPLLEYLDRERVTRRVGDERVIL